MRATERGVSPAHSSQTESRAPPNGWPRPRLLVWHSDAPEQAFRTRLCAVLAADMADYSRHMAEDEAGTHARFMALWRDVIEPAIAQSEGRTVKNTGDGFLAVFASATSAVRAAVGFQGAIRVWNQRGRGPSLQFRVGINLGDVIFEPHDVFGHSVNVAARLEALAEPGTVLVSYAVRASVRDPALSFKDVGELSLKNIGEAVRGFRARARRSPSEHQPSIRAATAAA